MGGEVACPLARVTGPNCVLPLVHGVTDTVGPHRKNITVPVTVPLLPVSVAVSVTDCPEMIDVALTCVTMAGGKSTAAAFRDRSWLPPPPSRETRNWWYGEPGMDPAPPPSP